MELAQVKTGTYVGLPAHKRLRKHLTMTGIGSGYLLTKKLGNGPFTPESLGNMIPSLVLRSIFPDTQHSVSVILLAPALAESGATVDEIMSILGHTTREQAALYVRQANRKTMAANAMKKW